MAIREIINNVYATGVNHWDRELFDELIPLPDGTSYNSYIIKGSEKTVLIDTADPDLEKEFFNNLNELNLEKIDYVIANHAEQDHSGSIPVILEKYPEAVLVTNEKCKSFLIDLLDISEERVKVIANGETISLGDKTLEFIIAPWVHWPETMLTYLIEDKILFPCDLFGSHLATTDMYAKDEKKVYNSAKRYYAEIMMPFRTQIKNHLKKLEDYEIRYIAPSHGPIYDRPEFIIDAYKDWISDDVKNEIILPYVSMHGSTKVMVEYFIDKLSAKGLTVKPYNLIKTDIGDLAMTLVDAATVIFATPTVLTGPHPAAVYAAYLTNALRPKTKFVSAFGSFGWAGKTSDVMKNLLSTLKAEFLEPVLLKGLPKEDALKELDRLVEEIYNKHKEANLL